MEYLSYYLMAGAIFSVSQMVFILLRNIPTPEGAPLLALKIGAISLFIWPALPFLFYMYARDLRIEKLPLVDRPTGKTMLKVARKHFDGMPFLVIAFDPEGQNLHVYSNADTEDRAKLLDIAVKSNAETRTKGDK